MKNITWTRPISPHLQIYKIEEGSVYSILHRIAGVMLMVLFLLTPFLLNMLQLPIILNNLTNIILILKIIINTIILLLVFNFAFHVLISIKKMLSEHFLGLIKGKTKVLTVVMIGFIFLLATIYI